MQNITHNPFYNFLARTTF